MARRRHRLRHRLRLPRDRALPGVGGADGQGARRASISTTTAVRCSGARSRASPSARWHHSGWSSRTARSRWTRSSPIRRPPVRDRRALKHGEPARIARPVRPCSRVRGAGRRRRDRADPRPLAASLPRGAPLHRSARRWSTSSSPSWWSRRSRRWAPTRTPTSAPGSMRSSACSSSRSGSRPGSRIRTRRPRPRSARRSTRWSRPAGARSSCSESSCR